MKARLKMDNLEEMSCLVAAALHDYEHPGVNNAFLTNMNDLLAIRHNDVSVLESHHLAASFKLMTDDKNNWAINMTMAEFKRLRQVIIQTVLTTDMSKHFSELGLL